MGKSIQNPGLWQTKKRARRFSQSMRFIRIFAAAVLLAFAAGTARSAEHDIYPAPEQAKSDLARALKTAAATHKRVLLDFGGNWCPDCQVLDIYFHDPH